MTYEIRVEHPDGIMEFEFPHEPWPDRSYTAMMYRLAKKNPEKIKPYTQEKVREIIGGLKFDKKFFYLEKDGQRTYLHMNHPEIRRFIRNFAQELIQENRIGINEVIEACDSLLAGQELYWMKSLRMNGFKFYEVNIFESKDQKLISNQEIQEILSSKVNSQMDRQKKENLEKIKNKENQIEKLKQEIKALNSLQGQRRKA